MFRRAAAGPHVKAVSDKAGLKRGESHAADVAGLSVAFEAVNQHHLADGGTNGALRLDEHLSILIRADETSLHRKGRKVIVPAARNCPGS